MCRFETLPISVEPSAYSEDSFQTIKLFPPTAAEAADAGGVDLKFRPISLEKQTVWTQMGPIFF